MKSFVAIMVAFLGLLLAGCSTPNIYDVKTEKTLPLETRRNDKVFVDVRNTSSLQQVDIGPQVRSALEARGYRVVGTPDEADEILRVNVRYSGLMEEAMKTENVVGGAAAGGVVGGLGGAAIGGRHSTAGGALIGLLAGAGLGYWLEKRDIKNTFITIVDFQVTQKQADKTYDTNVYARVREHDLTAEAAAQKAMPDIAAQIAGQFTNWSAVNAK